MTIILNGSTGITTPADTVTGNETVGGTLAVTGATTVGGVAVVAVAPSTSGNVLTSNGSAWVSSAPTGGVPTATAIGQVPFSTDGSTYTATQKITQGTAVASTSGTSIDFTGIPSWVKRVTVMFSNISTNGTSNYQVQIGAGSVTTSGYLSGSTQGTTGVASTTGFPVVQSPTAAFNYSGQMVITSLSSLAWVASSSLSLMSPNTGTTTAGNGSITLGGALDRIRITTVNGTDTFDAGSINILYE